MRKSELSRKEILTMIQTGKMTPEEGFQLLQQFPKNHGGNQEEIKSQQKIKNQEKITIKKELNIKVDEKAGKGRGTDVAIVGISGCFPDASNIHQFWDNLKNGVDSVKEVTKDRWDLEKYYDSDMRTPNKTYSKWLGMLSDVDKFDPLFFNISPREAEFMDPQQRVFLQEAWRAIEDAGYAPEELSGRKCGVFAGAIQGDYAQNVRDSGNEMDPQFITGIGSSFLAARIAYLLNLTGSNMAIDTACSSSLVAIHEACQSLNNHENEMAIAGGVYIITTPEMHIMTSKGGMLSREGKCKAFDDDADGFVLGEGCGVLILKRLDQALKDRDYIYGVIKGSRVNQDGKTNGITAPSVNSQNNLQVDVYKSFQINPEEISYIETHGTGTKLGDPIEASALIKSFKQFTSKEKYCALGSIKSNMGHALAAAGVAGIIKILLCMKYKKLVPSLHYKKTNRHINFEHSPFYVNTEYIDWKVETNKSRMAAISAFGLSGTNCHMIIEEVGELRPEGVQPLHHHWIPLSGKTEEALERKMEDLLGWINREGEKYPMTDIAYTLSVGRSPMAVRYAFVVEDLRDLKQQIIAALDTNSPQYFKKHLLQPVKKQDSIEVELCNSLIKELKGTLEKEACRDKLLFLSKLFKKGYTVNIRSLFEEKKGRKIPLPTYPFAKECYWVTDNPITEEEKQFRGETKKLHPLLESNTSTLMEQKFTTNFNGEEFFLRDHQVDNIKVLPGVSYIEMARSAGELAGQKKVQSIENVFWLKPIVVEEPQRVNIGLYQEGQDIEFEVFTEDGTNEYVHCQGQIRYQENEEPLEAPVPLNIEAIKSRSKSIKTSGECYELHQSRGLFYGETFRTIQEIYSGDNEALSMLQIQGSAKDDFQEYLLHPSIMDGALQTIIGLEDMSALETGVSYLPFAVNRVTVYGAMPEVCYAYITYGNNKREESGHSRKYDLSIADETGKIVAEIKGFVARPFNKQGASPSQSSVMYFNNEWVEVDHEELKAETPPKGNVLVFDEDSEIYDHMKNRATAETKLILVKTGEGFEKLKDDCYLIKSSREEDFRLLLETLNQRGEMPDKILYLWTKNQKYDAAFLIKDVEKGLYPIFYLSKALMAKRINKKIALVFGYNTNALPTPQNAAISGFGKTIGLENPNFLYKTVELKSSLGYDSQEQSNIFSKELNILEGGKEISYRDGKRKIKELTPVEMEKGIGDNLIKEKGVYFITGGAGGLGLIMAEYLSNKAQAKLVLTGRSPLREEQLHRIKAIEDRGSEVLYLRGDITVKSEVIRLMEEAKKTFGGINGIIHSAGVLRDNFIINKEKIDIDTVLAPKVHGTSILDEVTSSEELDFFVLFSAMASIKGNFGQCDYAYGNSFIDTFAEMRENLRKAGKRSGKTIAINWPLWEDGGMGIDEESKAQLKSKIGMIPLSTANGLLAFEDALKVEGSQLMVIEGLKQQVLEAMIPSKLEKKEEEIKEFSLGEEIQKEAEDYLKGVLSKIIKLPPNRIKSSEVFESYGIDSVMIVSINQELEKHFQDLPKTLLFEYQNIEELAQYFVNNQREQLVGKLGKVGGVATKPVAEKTTPKNNQINTNEVEAELMPVENVSRRRNRRNQQNITTATTVDQPSNQTMIKKDIAIIGLSGRFPHAESIEEFWANLRGGKDCISEIPMERWNQGEYNGALSSKWGGFMKDVDKFDPMFFNISPREAAFMDPQERLFLETAWHTFEDAGYTRSFLQNQEVGVFVGVMYGHYQMFGVEESFKGNPIAVNSSFSSIANRVSYYFNLLGPSMAVDTMCSSSITSIHLACQSIQTGECQMAIAGGVNVSIHPNKYLMLSQGNFLSSHGRCKSFGDGGDGYVPGEGVGAVLLKPLDQAVADGDQIYGVIKGSSMNHGGKTNGYSVPNPNAQGKVIASALRKSGVEARSIGYIEAHGTGTSLGDPIEVTGLTKAFEEFTKDKGFCSIGSVKSNIGHLESAAGIAGIAKVLMQMRYKELVPSMHAEKLNPNLNFKDTPFYVQQKLQPWQPIAVKGEQGEMVYPRRAGISAFGAGGSNAHILLEEYIPANNHYDYDAESPQLFILSAKNKEGLRQYATKFYRFVDEKLSGNASTEEDLVDVNPLLMKDLEEIIGTVTGVNGEELNIDDIFQEVGCDAITLAKITTHINEKYNLELNPMILSEFHNIEEMSQYLIQHFLGNMSNYYRTFKENHFKDEYPIELADIAYTLQIGREAMEERLAIVVDTLEELRDGLKDFLSGNNGESCIYTGNIKANKEKTQLLIDGRAGEEFIKIIVSDKEYDKLAQLWVSGVDMDWRLLYQQRKPKKVSLPNYTFARKSYWVGQNQSQFKETPTAPMAPMAIKKPVESFKTPSATSTAISTVNSNVNETSRESMKKYEKEILNYNGDEVTLQILDGCIALVTLQDKANRNSFSNNLILGLMAKFNEIQQNKNIKVAIVTGYENIFSMGGTQDQLMDISQRTTSFTEAPFMYRGLLETEIPVISAMQGHASGGGMLFGLYADIVVMSEDSVYSAVFTKYGFTPGMGATLILKERFGPTLSTEMMLTAKSYRGEELKARGASVSFKKSKDVLKEAIKIAKSLADKPSNTLRVLKKNLASKIIEQFPTVLQQEDHMHDLTFNNDEVRGRIQRFYSASKSKSSKGETTVNQPTTNQSREKSSSVIQPQKKALTLNPPTGNRMTENQKEKEIKVTQKISLTSTKPPVPAIEGHHKPLNKETLEGKIASIVGKVLHMSAGELSYDLSFKDMGVDSISGVEIIRDINKEFDLNLDAVALYDYATIPELAEYIVSDNSKIKVEGSLDYSGILKDMYNAEEKPQPIKHNLILEDQQNNLDEAVVEGKIIEILSAVLHIPTDEVEKDLSFKDMGVDSISGVEIVRDLNKEFDMNLDAVALYDYATIPELTQYILEDGGRVKVEGSLDYSGILKDMYQSESPLEAPPETKKISLKNHEIAVTEEVIPKDVPTFKEAASFKEVSTLDGGMIQQKIMGISAAVLHMTEDEIDLDISFKDMGVDSISGVEIIRDINKEFDLNLDAVALYDYATIPELTEYILSDHSRVKVEGSLDYSGILKDMYKEDAPEVIENAPKIHEVAPNIHEEKTRIEPLEGKKLKKLEPINPVKEQVLQVPVERKVVLQKPQSYKNGFEKIEKLPMEAKEESPKFEGKSEDRKGESSPTKGKTTKGIAVVGMSGRFPGAKNLKEFWKNLENGVSSIEEIPKERWNIDDYYDPNPLAKEKTYCRTAGFLEEADRFDPLFFNISPTEAISMDPQQRIFLEETYKALEDAGYCDTDLYNQKCGVFVGSSRGDYGKLMADLNLDNSAHAFTGLSPTILAARISYFLNLKGPSIVLDTACSSSLVAIHQACQSIVSGECDVALAGGGILMFTPDLQILTSQTGMLSPDGKCKTFDKNADGIAIGEGVGVIVLKSLEKAIEDRDHIYGVIKGWGSNQDGKTNGLTAPSAKSQTALEVGVYEKFGINPEEISYVEAHGTGTKLGDPIEVKALTDAFRRFTDKKQYCGLGSVKTNIGHTTMAAGVTSVIKVLLSMKYKKLPPLLNFTEANEHINLEDSPFYINTELIDWKPSGNIPRIAAVSSFGYSGTNCHLVLEEFEETE